MLVVHRVNSNNISFDYCKLLDSLSVDDFYKVYGYTNFYKADTGKVNEIPIQELTITLVSKQYPRELIRHLKEVRHYTIDNLEEGIYYVIGNRINQLILKLSELNRTDEILKAAADREYQKKLLKEFGL